MGLLVECPECRRRNSLKAKNCKCGFALAKFSGRVWWIEYYDHEKRLRRERIGPNKTAAEHRYREVISTRTEGRYIKKSPDASTLFKNLAAWYLNLPEVKAKRSYDRDQLTTRKLIPFFGECLLRDINPALVEAYRQKRLSEPSGRTPTTLTAPATVNREVACLKTIFSKAVINRKAERNPVMGVKLLKENNKRDRILSPEEYARLLAHCPAHLKPIVKLAYYTGMRQGEILNLKWDRVDLSKAHEGKGFIHLKPEDTKTIQGRSVPLNREMVEMFKAMPRGLPAVPVFTYQGKSIGAVKRSFITACRRADIEDFTFHDLRHTFINNRRVEGHDYFRIMAATGHKTMSVFRRYNTVSKDELQALVNGKSE
jgi:integrase